MTYKDINDFLASRPDIKELREIYKQYSNIVDLLKGDFDASSTDIHSNEKPKVRSWVINQGLKDPKKNPTYGFMPLGEHELNLEDYAQHITVLDGELDMETSKAFFTLNTGEGEDIPPYNRAILTPKGKPVLYIMEYEKN